MKRIILTGLIVAVFAGSAWGGRKPAPRLTFEDVQRQAYWYSLYNVAHLTMFSGLGRVMERGGMSGLIDWLKGGGVQKAELMSKMKMISSVYRAGDPHFVQKVDPEDPKTMGWDRSKMDKTLDPSAHAFTIIKSVAKNFHRDYHETKQNQRVAIAMYPEAKEMARALAQPMRDKDGFFVQVSPRGVRSEPKSLDQASALWAFSDLVLVALDPELPPYHDHKLADWAARMADEAFVAVLKLPPRTAAEIGIAIEALGRYSAASVSRDARSKALSMIGKLAERLRQIKRSDITEMGLSVYALIEASRITGEFGFKKEALKIFNEEMEPLWDDEAGVYANSSGVPEYVYTPFDVGAVLAALNSIIWFTMPPYERPQEAGPSLARGRYVRFFENSVVISGMQLSSDLSLVERLYLKRESRIRFTHPAIPDMQAAGGSYGAAPVYASRVRYSNGEWSVVDGRFNTRDAMFLAVMSVLLNRHDVDAFVPLGRLTARLVEDLGMKPR
jgi:hypothetical protein